jgi:hypothetical protein
MQHNSLSQRNGQAAVEACWEVTARRTYFLSAHSYCCELEDGAIILELATGVYVGIHAEYLPHLRIRIPNWPDSHGSDQVATDQVATDATITESESLISSLVDRGILTTSPVPKRWSTPPTPVAAMTTGSAIECSGTPAKHLMQFMMSLWTVSLRHRDDQVASLVGLLSRRQRLIRRVQRSASLDDAKKILAAFLRLRIWFYTADRRCLFDSLVLALFLSRKKIPCTFVIGVSTKPFLAHAWVQIGEFVLNDTAEHVQTFTPILAVGESN